MQTFQALKKYDFVTNNLDIYSYIYIGPIENGALLFRERMKKVNMYEMKFWVLSSDHEVLYDLSDPTFIHLLFGIFDSSTQDARLFVKEKSWRPELYEDINDFWYEALRRLDINPCYKGVKKLKNMAYERGHSEGFKGIWNELVDLVDLINGWK